MDLNAYIRDVPDFPKPGIIFKDITPLLGNPDAFARTIDILADRYASHGFQKVAGIESRGFLFGAPLALRLNCGFAPIRKKGKLPAKTVSQTFDLEYGQDTIEIHLDAIQPGEKVLIIDDLLATGGTLVAAAQLVEKVGGRIGEIATVIELSFLNGRARLGSYPYFACLKY